MGMVKFEEGCQGSERLGVVAISSKSTPGRRKSRCKGPEVGRCQDTSVVSAVSEGRVGGDGEGGEVLSRRAMWPDFDLMWRSL